MGTYIDPGDVDSWPSGCDATCKADTIKFAEELMEKILGRHFYVKPFDLEINGNDKNRIALPLYADIVTVDHVYICGIELASTWYAYDQNSVYLNLCGSGAFMSGASVLVLAFAAADARVLEGLFPRGHNNCRFVGTHGEALPQPLKQALIWLVDSINDGTFGTGAAGGFKSERIGDYSYTKGLVGYWKEGVLTGIDKVDAVLRHYVKQKKPIIMAP